MLCKLNRGEYKHHDQVNDYKLLHLEAKKGGYTFLQESIGSCGEAKWKVKHDIRRLEKDAVKGY